MVFQSVSKLHFGSVACWLVRVTS